MCLFFFKQKTSYELRIIDWSSDVCSSDLERVRIMRDPEFRRQLLSEDPVAGSTFPLIHRIGYAHMFRFGNPPCYAPKREGSIAAIAAREGRTAPEIAYDILIEDGGREIGRAPV